MTIAVIFLFLCVITTPILYKKYKVKRWRKSLQLDTHEQAFNLLYHDINGFLLSKKARETGDAPEFLYGEIEFESFVALISLCEPNSNTVFYDLGSGTGKAVIACAMVFSVQKSCGIEWFSSLHKASEMQQKKLLSLLNYQSLPTNFFFKEGDFLKEKITDATLIFINATAFFGEHWKSISRHLEQILSGAQVISTSKILVSDQFILLRTVPVMMSWGVVLAYIQKRR